jgi:hypothetical protein
MTTPSQNDPLQKETTSAAEQRYARFEPITVRAATRILQLQQAGVVTENEARFYVRELVAMDAHAGEGAFQSLLRAAQRRAAPRRTSRKSGEPTVWLSGCQMSTAAAG